MTLIANLIFDTATLVLIWAVQLAIYPALTYYGHENLRIWHRSYTKRITLVVLPLMFGQLGFTVLAVLGAASFIAVTKLVLIILVWILTFTIFVPLHNRIEESTAMESRSIASNLVSKNWWRTLLWTLVFILSAYQIFIHG
ncbi:hypothetical protein ACFQZJ_10365 [Maribacter chungangensis]|uniref:DUF1772 domain-containing protein n=1 Tax=Maribacter chungangensis TaxID=1069117 RepID=A0ABW3B4U0_9FLAO